MCRFARGVFATIAVLALGMTDAGAVSAVKPVKVVASFSILGDLVGKVGGEHVRVVTLVGPNGDAHIFEPSPAAAREAAGADLIVVSGLGFEGWLDRLIEASGYTGKVAVLTEGVDLIETEGEIDPHAWQAVENARIYVKNIAEALCAAEPAVCLEFRGNASAYDAELAELDRSIKAGFEAVPKEQRQVITTHDAFGYFGRAYGVSFLAPQGVSTDSEASAGDVARLIEQIREQGVTALFVENVSDPRLTEQIARETGVELGGELYSDALSGPDGPASTYVDMMHHNAGLLQGAMRGS